MTTEFKNTGCCSQEEEKGSSCCGSGDSTKPKMVTEEIEFSIDGIAVKAIPGDKNIVDAADRAGIGIPAPCYRNDRLNGCCNVCVVEIDSVQKFACCTLPEEGMKIILKRDDLMAIRKQRAQEYKANMNNGSSCGCSSGCC